MKTNVALDTEAKGGIKVGEVWTVDSHAYRVVKKTGPRSFMVQHLGKVGKPVKVHWWTKLWRSLAGNRK